MAHKNAPKNTLKKSPVISLTDADKKFLDGEYLEQFKAARAQRDNNKQETLLAAASEALAKRLKSNPHTVKSQVQPVGF